MLSGSLGGMILTPEGNPYLVREDIVIPSGKKTTIREGCIILFQPYTGIIVNGSLVVEGTAVNPVVFTSVNDTVYGTQKGKNPEPFDWNGILLEQRARNVRLSHFILTYSVYGIKSQIDDVIILQGIFANNGQYHFTIRDVIKPLTEALPYSYNDTTLTDFQTSQSGRSTLRWRRPLSIAVMAISVAGGAGGVGYSYIREREFRTKYYNDENSSNEFDRYHDDQQKWRNFAIIAGSAGGTFLVAGAVLFTVDHLTGKSATVAVVPRFGRENGISLTIPLGGGK